VVAQHTFEGEPVLGSSCSPNHELLHDSLGEFVSCMNIFQHADPDRIVNDDVCLIAEGEGRSIL
jgi:hypothetical protein